MEKLVRGIQGNQKSWCGGRAMRPFTAAALHRIGPMSTRLAGDPDRTSWESLPVGHGIGRTHVPNVSNNIIRTWIQGNRKSSWGWFMAVRVIQKVTFQASVMMSCSPHHWQRNIQFCSLPMKKCVSGILTNHKSWCCGIVMWKFSATALLRIEPASPRLTRVQVRSSWKSPTVGHISGRTKV